MTEKNGQKKEIGYNLNEMWGEEKEIDSSPSEES